MKLGTAQNSPLQYSGGKSKRVFRLLRLADQSRKHYIEPFAGSLAMMYRACREKLFRTYSVNDLDGNLVNFYTILRDHADEMLKVLWKHYNKHGPGDEELFQKCIEDLSSANKITRAVAYFIINKWSMKGAHTPTMIRRGTRSKGVTQPMLCRLPLFSELLSGVKITNLDYRDIDVPTNSFLYADPPYERVGSTFYKHRVDLSEFSEWAKHLRSSWMVSLNDSDYTNSLFYEYDRILEPVSYPAIVNRKFDSYKRRNATELVIMNYHRSTRDAFVRQFGWKIKPAKEHLDRCSKRAG